MFKRLLSALKGARHTDADDAVMPLCRLRHATLHPGAALWTPGVGGGNLGGGAASALDEVGLGGEVVVGFQSGAREPVHTHGVIARVEERVAFPDSWNPEGLGASHRYRLLGLRRVRLDPSSATNKRVPTIQCSPLADRPEDATPPPPELVELLTALARLDNNWPDHWRDAFLSLPEAQLGQWATTLGWRLSRDERLLLFDQPQRIAEVLLSTLDGLHLGLAPERRREAVRVQTVTRRTTLMPERTLEVIADEDGWAIFHPADLHASAQPSGLGLAGHFVAGNVIAVRSHPGRSCRVSLTAYPPTQDEGRHLGEITFRLLVRHGRLFLGGATLMRPSHYHDRLEFAEAAQWFDIPNGVYRATVIALAPPQSGPSYQPAYQVDGPSDESPEPETVPVPEYVVVLRPSETFEDVAAPETPPEL